MSMPDSVDHLVGSFVISEYGPSIEEKLLGMLHESSRSLDEIGHDFPIANWAQIFLAIDRLSRSGAIQVWSNSNGDYLLRTRT